MDFLDVLKSTDLLKSSDKTPKNSDKLQKKNAEKAQELLDMLKEDEDKLHEANDFV